MILASGLLLLAAVALLVMGLLGSSTWVYLALAVSLGSLIVQLLAVRQRRSAPE